MNFLMYKTFLYFSFIAMLGTYCNACIKMRENTAPSSDGTLEVVLDSSLVLKKPSNGPTELDQLIQIIRDANRVATSIKGIRSKILKIAHENNFLNFTIRDADYENMATHGHFTKSSEVSTTPHENFIPKDADFYHENMANYIGTCWNIHAGVVMRPDMFYFTVFSEIAKYVIANADECRHLFTTEKQGKQEIVIDQDTSKCIDFDLLVDALKAKIPSKVDALLPSFSTDTTMSKEARLASFAETVSPYYRYFTIVCGIPKVRLEGTEADWANIRDALKGWIELLPGKKMRELYLPKMLEIAEHILADVRSHRMTYSFWKNMYRKKVSYQGCGAPDEKVHGWMVDMYGKNQGVNAADLRGHITRVKWTALEPVENRKFVVNHGLFSSKFKANTTYLVPEFSRIVFNRPNDDED